MDQIVDFNIILQTDGKNINGYIVYDEDNMWPLELTSGMERFISSLAIRVALINVSALPRPNFIAIDEGWNAFDYNNVNNIGSIMDFLRNKFDFILSISHLQVIRQYCDHQIKLKKDMQKLKRQKKFQIQRSLKNFQMKFGFLKIFQMKLEVNYLIKY